MGNNFGVYVNCIKICLAIFILIIGCLIYAGYRSDDLLMFEWFDYLGVSNHVMCFRDICSEFHIPNFIKFSLPDGLWVLSYMMIIGVIWNSRNFMCLLFMYSIPFVAIAL